ncbi:hypothetical protein O6H91_Y096600 [Diphasiastrum complanatum]|nr:hypothetical protein O6H91_Y096600 [Diphasiastrum complanatum]
MALLVDVTFQKSWSNSTNRSYEFRALNKIHVCNNKIDHYNRPVACRSFKPSKDKQKNYVAASESAPLLKSCVHNHLQAGKDTKFCKLQSERLDLVNAARKLRVCATATSETFTAYNRRKLPAVPKLSHRWREIQGEDDWKNLLDPLDPDLKAEMIKYGEFAQLCYDAFDNDSHSEYSGSCRVNPRKLLKAYGIWDEDYEITKYLYATSNICVPEFFHRSNLDHPWSKDSNWIGFVAVSTSKRELERLGRRDIVVAFRGTVTHIDLLVDLKKSLCPSGLDPRSVGRSSQGDVRVETGFLSLYITNKTATRYNQHSARQQLLTEIQRLKELYKDEELSISLTGHSLGAALALLSGYDLAESGLNIKPGKASCRCFNPSVSMSLQNNSEQDIFDRHKDVDDKIPITVFSFAGPRVGNNSFRDRINQLGVKVLRVVNVNDLVPKVPGLLLNEKFQFVRNWIDRIPWTYSHVGVEFAINNQHSHYLQSSFDPCCLHNLEAYLHLIDGYIGSGREFNCDMLSRDPALVNKSSNFLKSDRRIPSFWRQDKDKGLVKDLNGRLKFPDREPEDIPPYDQC